jgi:hypothetical protein
MKKQTAVAWLIEQLLKKSDVQYINGFDGLIEQAIAKERIQIIDAVDGYPIEHRHLDGDQYYNETYNK